MESLKSTFKLHPFYCPIEPALHPKVEQIEQQAIAWLDQFRFYNTQTERAWIIGTNSAEFCARLAPNGIEENLLPFVLWVYWGFAFDDAKCDSSDQSMQVADFVSLAAFFQRVLEAPFAPLSNNDPFVVALQDISQRLHKCATPAQIRRFIDGHRKWLSGTAWQLANLSRNYVPSINEYFMMRLYTVGASVTSPLIEIANGEEIPSQEIDSPIVTAINEITSLIAALDNDFVSYWKEVHHQQSDSNILNVLMYNNHSTLEQAMSDAVAIRDRLMHLFLSLREQIWPQASQELRNYLNCLGYTIRGNIDWSLKVLRYTSLSDISTLPTPGQAFTAEWTDKPEISTAPLPFPAISWWWDYLQPTEESSRLSQPDDVHKASTILAI